MCKSSERIAIRGNELCKLRKRIAIRENELRKSMERIFGVPEQGTIESTARRSIEIVRKYKRQSEEMLQDILKALELK